MKICSMTALYFKPADMWTLPKPEDSGPLGDKGNRESENIVYHKPGELT